MRNPGDPKAQSDTFCTMYRSHDGYWNVFCPVGPGAMPALQELGSLLMRMPADAASSGKWAGMSTVIGMEEILSLRLSVLMGANGSGSGGSGVGIQGEYEEDAVPDGEGAAEDEEHDAVASSAARGSVGQSARISARASALDGCRRSTSRRSAVV